MNENFYYTALEDLEIVLVVLRDLRQDLVE